MVQVTQEQRQKLGSNLSKTAQEVFPHLQRAHKELRKYIEEIEKTMVTLANKIIKGEGTESEKIDFRIHLADIKVRILEEIRKGFDDIEESMGQKAPEVIARWERIRRNFIDKVEREVLKIG